MDWQGAGAAEIDRLMDRAGLPEWVGEQARRTHCIPAVELVATLVQRELAATELEMFATRGRLGTMFTALREEPRTVERSAVLELIRDISRLVHIGEDQHDVWHRLRHLDPADLGHHDDTHRSLRAAAFSPRDLDRLEERGRYLFDLYRLSRAEGTDRHLRTLTIVNVVFLPLMLITGIYGMNFDFSPFMHSAWGFYGTMAVMLTLVATLITWFRRHGWLE